MQLIMHYQPSFKRTPSEPVLLARSDPARSTKWSFAERYSSPISSSEESLMGEPEWSLRICCNDTIFFGEATIQNIKAIKAILRGFELASGLKINFAKNSLMAFGKSDLRTKEAAEYLNCRILAMPFTYLGIPIGANPRHCELGTNESLWWQDLMVVTQEQQLNNVMQSGLSWNVGSGDKIKFWEDCWNGEGQVGSFSDTSWEWNLTWRRQLFDNEADSTYEFMRELSQLFNNKYLIAGYGNMSLMDFIRQGVSGWSTSRLWKLKIPAKASIFAWRLIRDRLPTKSNLHRRQVVLEDTLCSFCRIREEDASHIFFECNKILPLWWESQTWVRSLGVSPINTRQHFLQHVHGKPGSQRYNRWKTWWIALNWSIWKSIGMRSFSRMHNSMESSCWRMLCFCTGHGLELWRKIFLCTIISDLAT
ncbi:hypothetical protein HKD37_05G012732 [Glycine soja]